jgi:hypothetical protein
MEITRRGFLSVLGVAGAAAMVIDPEMLLWRPGAKTIFMPSDAQIRYFSAGITPHGVVCKGDPITRNQYRSRLGREMVWMVDDQKNTVTTAAYEMRVVQPMRIGRQIVVHGVTFPEKQDSARIAPVSRG